MAAAISYKGMIPSEGLGITGFDVGVSAGVTEVANRDVLKKAAGGASVPKAVPLAGLRALLGKQLTALLGFLEGAGPACVTPPSWAARAAWSIWLRP